MRVVIACALLVACAGEVASAQAREVQRTSKSVLTQREMLEKNFENVQDALEAMRPRWLRTRGQMTLTTGSTQIKVYFDNVMFGGTDKLREVPVRTVSSVRFLDGPDAQARYGIGHEAGVIVIESVTRQPIAPPPAQAKPAESSTHPGIDS